MSEVWGSGLVQGGTVSVRGGIAMLTLYNAPNNALSQAVRTWMRDALTQALAAPEVDSILISGAGAGFSVGFDTASYDSSKPGRQLADLCGMLETAEKPVVAALHGAVSGAALDLALAAHYRVAHEKTLVQSPEVLLGVVPCAGGTQRLPRLIGVPAALNHYVTGARVLITDPRLSGLTDMTVPGDPVQAALKLCVDLRRDGSAPRPTGARPMPADRPTTLRQAIETHRANVNDLPETAARELVNCVEAASLLPLEAGLAFESAAFEACVQNPQSAALRRTYAAERRATQAARPRKADIQLKRIAILGPGKLAGQIAFAALRTGLGVSWGLLDLNDGPVCKAHLAKLQNNAIARRQLTEAQRERQTKICDIVMAEEAVDEGDVILQAAAGQGTIPSDPRIARLNCMIQRNNSLSLRFAQPVHSAQLVEVIEGPEAREDDRDVALALAQRLGKLPIRVKSSGVAVSDRLLSALYRGTDALVDAGLSPYEVDAAMLSWGWGLPPFQLRDLHGLHFGASGQMRVPGGHAWSKVLLDAGRTGRAAGAGFYTYTSDGAVKPTRKVLELINQHRPPARRMRKATAQALVLGALVNEGARILDDGWVRAPSELDLVSLHAMGLPRWRGGIMTSGDLAGLFTLVRAMKAFDHPDRPFWTPHEILSDLIKNGRSFASLNG